MPKGCRCPAPWTTVTVCCPRARSWRLLVPPQPTDGDEQRQRKQHQVDGDDRVLLATNVEPHRHQLHQGQANTCHDGEPRQDPGPLRKNDPDGAEDLEGADHLHRPRGNGPRPCRPLTVFAGGKDLGRTGESKRQRRQNCDDPQRDVHRWLRSKNGTVNVVPMDTSADGKRRRLVGRTPTPRHASAPQLLIAGAARRYRSSVSWATRNAAMSARVMAHPTSSRPRKPDRMRPVAGASVGRVMRAMVQSRPDRSTAPVMPTRSRRALGKPTLAASRRTWARTV